MKSKLITFLSISDNSSFNTSIIISNKVWLKTIRRLFSNNIPNVSLTLIHRKLTRSTSSFFLLFHVFVEAFYIHFHTLLASHQLGQVDWETIGIMKFERIFAGNFILAFHHFIEQLDSLPQCFQETLLF